MKPQLEICYKRSVAGPNDRGIELVSTRIRCGDLITDYDDTKGNRILKAMNGERIEAIIMAHMIEWIQPVMPTPRRYRRKKK